MKQDNCCKICGNVRHNKLYQIRERQLNQGGMFRYVYCNRCGTLQLIDKIRDISLYYPFDYYSFNMSANEKKTFNFLRKICINLILNFPVKLPGKLEEKIWNKFAAIKYLYGCQLNLDSSILDVGGGNGRWLEKLRQYGFKDLTCIDLFCQKSPFEAVKFMRCDIRELDNSAQFDVITFHHSFEHMQEPENILRKVKELLKKNGVCLIRIPVCECEAWNRYKENWYQIDAPRHYYLYTERALRELCHKCNLQICKVVYDSEPEQFVVSEYYKNTNLSLKEIRIKINRDKRHKRHSIKVQNQINKSGRGDQAAFYIKHIC